uniref:CUB domain-containing protein 1 isoform X1 n=1 Tax=Pogona vitticeps TaxID=103695 RepID=A0A6J0URK1_9SAUR
MAPDRRIVRLLLLTKLLLALELILQGAGAAEISLHRNESVTVRIKPEVLHLKTCALRTGGKPFFTEQKIHPGQSFNFVFDCPTPEKYWVLVIEKNIDCMSGPCPFGDLLLHPSGLPHLNRTFVWEVKADRLVGLELKFSTWLRQIMPGETCADHILYNIGSRLNTNRVNIGNFCRNGSVSRVKVQGGLSLTLQLPWDSKVNSSGFKLESRSSIQRLCIIEATFQNESSATLMSANYPLGMPEDELMTWQFVIPGNLRADIFIRNYSKPKCERKFERLDYSLPPSYSNNKLEGVSLDAEQPSNIPGSFNLSLQGCDQDDRNPGALSLLFDVVVRYPKNEGNVTLIIDLKKESRTNLTIYSKPESHLTHERRCLICVNSNKDCKHNVTLEPRFSYKVTFLCLNLENIRIIAEHSIACWNFRSCPKFSPLVVPSSLTRLPILLERYTWKIQAPEDVSIEIKSPNLKLKQHIPDQNQKCTGSYSYAVNSTTPGKAVSVGLFCPGGAIEKIQMKGNLTVTLTTYGKRWFNESQKQDLQLLFIPIMPEECIFSLTPDSKTKVYLQTPNWLEGMPPFMSVYWNISVPAKQVAQLAFLSERMGVTCERGRAYINIKEQNPNAEETVCRDDQILPKTLDMRHHFWINITNCKPSAKQLLSMQLMVTFIQKKTDLAIIIGAVVGGIAVLMAIVLVIFCTKRKNRKKETPTPMVGVYNTNVNTQLPGRQGLFQKNRKANESHIYAVIDEDTVYGHLLNSSTIPETAETGVYRPFSGPMSTTPPSPPPFRKASKVPDTEESSFTLVTDPYNYTIGHHPPRELQSNGDVNGSHQEKVNSKPSLENRERENSVE